MKTEISIERAIIFLLEKEYKKEQNNNPGMDFRKWLEEKDLIMYRVKTESLSGCNLKNCMQ